MKEKKIFGKKYNELTGCIHNHTEYSFDCSVPIAQIISEAKENDLDYFTINDHRNKKAKKDEAVLIEKELKVIVGTEINDKDNYNHYLVFECDDIQKNSTVEEYMHYYKKKNAVTFAAHPFEKRASKKFRKYHWTNFKNDDFSGLEIWNFLSSWLGKMNPRLNGLFLILFPAAVVRTPHRELLSYWDELNNSGKRKSAIGSIDAHKETYKKFGIRFKFLTHKYLFGTIRTNVLIPEDKPANEQNIIKSIKNGNSYIVNYKRGNPYNFYGGICDDNGVGVSFGEEIPFKENLKYYFNLPENSNVHLYRNGVCIKKQLDFKGFFEIEEDGNYRLEILRFGKGWIYTNNIYVV